MQRKYIVEKTAGGFLPFRKTWYGKQYIGETEQVEDGAIDYVRVRVPCATYQVACETCAKDACSRVSVRVEGELLKRRLDAAHASCDHLVNELIRERDTVRELQGKVSSQAIVISLLEHHVKTLQEKRDDQAKTIGDLRNEVEVLRAVDTLRKSAPKSKKVKHDKA